MSWADGQYFVLLAGLNILVIYKVSNIVVLKRTTTFDFHIRTVPG